jgi:hypothetical protein
MYVVQTGIDCPQLLKMKTILKLPTPPDWTRNHFGLVNSESQESNRAVLLTSKKKSMRNVGAGEQ